MHIAQNWRINAQRYAMKGLRCETCQKVTFPPREVCPYCAAVANSANHANNIVAFPGHDSKVIDLPDVVVLQRAGR
jgi:uncharacterized OB-fold protein